MYAIIFLVLVAELKKCHDIFEYDIPWSTLKTGTMLNNKIRSHARAVTDWIFVPELTASPRPQATGWQSVQGQKSNQLLPQE